MGCWAGGGTMMEELEEFGSGAGVFGLNLTDSDELFAVVNPYLIDSC